MHPVFRRANACSWAITSLRIRTNDFSELCQEHGRKQALTSLLLTMAHELTHYFQWVNDLQLTEIGMERQANNYARKIIRAYAETRDCP